LQKYDQVLLLRRSAQCCIACVFTFSVAVALKKFSLEYISIAEIQRMRMREGHLTKKSFQAV
jgi:hypothetical protein